MADQNNFDKLFNNLDPVEQKVPEITKKKSKRGLWIFGVILAVVPLLAFGTWAGLSMAKQQKIEQAKKTEEIQQQIKKKAIQESDNPMATLVGKRVPVSEQPYSVKIEDNRIVVSDGSTITLPDTKLNPIINPCIVKLETDVCLAALANSSKADYSIYLVKDMSKSRFLENPENFTEINAGKNIAATMTIDIQDGRKVPVGAITANGTTGFILIFKDGIEEKTISEILSKSIIL